MATSKRDFGHAFDNPVGSPGDNVAAEPQAYYTSQTRRVPGQWPADESSNDTTTAPSPPRSVFCALTQFATSLTTEVFNLPERLVNCFTRPQQILVVPVTRGDGASKRRLVDAGLAPNTPTTSTRAGILDHPDVIHTLKSWAEAPHTHPDVTHTPKSWAETSSTPPVLSTSDRNEIHRDDDIDISRNDLDCSMDDVDSSTPIHNTRTVSPTGISWPGRSEHKLRPTRTSILSTTAYYSALRRTPVSMMRKQLLKGQLRTVEPVSSTSPLLAAPLTSDVTFKDVEQSLFPSGSSAPQSLHSQSPSPRSESPSSRSVSPPPVQRNSVRRATQCPVKPHYIDEAISEMLDNTLKLVRSPIAKPNSTEDEDDVKDYSKDYVEDYTKDDVDSITPTKSHPRFDSKSVHGPSTVDVKDYTDEDYTKDFVDPVILAKAKDYTEDFVDPVVDPSLLDDFVQESQLSQEFLSDWKALIHALPSKQILPPPAPKPLVTPLTPEERTKLNAIAVASQHGRNESYPIVPNKVSARDFGTLLPHLFNGSAKAWLNDEIVNQYLITITKILNDECGFVYKRGGPAPPYHAFSSHWYTSIKGGVKKVERWASRAGLGGIQFLDAKVVLFPVCDGSHWRLLAVKPQDRTIEYFDSLGWEGGRYVAKLGEYLQNELGEGWRGEEWTVAPVQRSARQLNGSDCGVFALLNAVAVVRGAGAERVVAYNGMEEARERLAMTIITGEAQELE